MEVRVEGFLDDTGNFPTEGRVEQFDHHHKASAGMNKDTASMRRPMAVLPKPVLCSRKQPIGREK